MKYEANFATSAPLSLVFNKAEDVFIETLMLKKDKRQIAAPWKAFVLCLHFCVACFLPVYS